MRYNPKDPGQELEDSLRRYLLDETSSLKDVLSMPSFDIIELELLNALPAKPRTGMVGNFAAGVATASEGIHRYSSGGAWVFVG